MCGFPDVAKAPVPECSTGNAGGAAGSWSLAILERAEVTHISFWISPVDSALPISFLIIFVMNHLVGLPLTLPFYFLVILIHAYLRNDIVCFFMPAFNLAGTEIMMLSYPFSAVIAFWANFVCFSLCFWKQNFCKRLLSKLGTTRSDVSHYLPRIFLPDHPLIFPASSHSCCWYACWSAFLYIFLLFLLACPTPIFR